MEKIPCDNQIRKLLDTIAPDEAYDLLKHDGYLSEYTGLLSHGISRQRRFTAQTVGKSTAGTSALFIVTVIISIEFRHEQELILKIYDMQDCEEQ